MDAFHKYDFLYLDNRIKILIKNMINYIHHKMIEEF
jgi:hypothetical protein